jgi:hypothetical protein
MLRCCNLLKNSAFKDRALIIYLKGVGFKYMKKMYDISKAQLITLWVFGFFIWIWSINQVDYGSSMGSFFAILIPFLLTFYTIGWRAEKKSGNFPNYFKTILSFLRRILKIYSGLLILIISIIIGFFILNNSNNNTSEDTLPNLPGENIGSKSVNNAEGRPLIETISFATNRVSSNDNSLDFYMSDFINFGPQVVNDFIYKTYSPSPITSGNYSKVVFYANNLTKMSRKIKLVSINLVDDQERVFAKNLVFHCGNPLQEFSYNDFYSFNSVIEIKPGIPCKFSALFETPIDLKTAYIKISYINN